MSADKPFVVHGSPVAPADIEVRAGRMLLVRVDHHGRYAGEVVLYTTRKGEVHQAAAMTPDEARALVAQLQLAVVAAERTVAEPVDRRRVEPVRRPGQPPASFTVATRPTDAPTGEGGHRG